MSAVSLADRTAVSARSHSCRLASYRSAAMTWSSGPASNGVGESTTVVIGAYRPDVAYGSKHITAGSAGGHLPPETESRHGPGTNLKSHIRNSSKPVTAIAAPASWPALMVAALFIAIPAAIPAACSAAV